MAFKKYTQCYKYLPELYPTSKPFNVDDLAMLGLVHVIQALTLMGSFTIVGLILGPVGAIVGAVVGFVVGITTGMASALHSASDQWRFHRLICLSEGDKCAVGTVAEGPKKSDLGAFDNDEYFDVMLMPHRFEDNYVTLTYPAVNANPPKHGTVADDQTKNIEKHPANEIYEDGFQGQKLLLQNPGLAQPPPGLGYVDHKNDPEREELHTASMLHCEAEGDFWVRVKDLAVVIGLLATLTVATAVAGGVAGASAGAAAGCAILSWFFGPVGCAIGSWLGGLIGGALGAAAGAAASGWILYLVLQAIFNVSPGEVEDANVGDKNLGEIRAGSRVAVLGEHVYDGFHQGWHEFHPLKAVIKIEPDNPRPEDKESFFLTWNPDFPAAGGQFPKAAPGMPPEIADLTVDDMQQGLNSAKFRSRAEWLKTLWCDLLKKAFDEATQKAAQGLTHRWTIHPMVDGCEPAERPDLH